MNILKELYSINIIKTIYFNLYYLPLKQAIKLPILLYGKIKLKKMDGNITIDTKPKTGFIKLGKSIVSLYKTRDYSLVWENRGQIAFKGNFILGEGSSISTGINGYLEFGKNFAATSKLKIACYNNIIIQEDCRFSWENIVVDTDFHETINITSGERSLPIGQVLIGKNNWIGMRALILKGTETPDFCTVGPGSILNKKYLIPEYSLIAGIPARLKKENIFMDFNSFVK